MNTSTRNPRLLKTLGFSLLLLSGLLLASDKLVHRLSSAQVTTAFGNKSLNRLSPTPRAMVASPAQGQQDAAERLLNKSNPAAADLLAQAQSEGQVRVIVGLRASFRPEGTFENLTQVQTQRLAIVQAQDSLLSRMTAFNVTGIKQFRAIPFMAMEVDAAAVQFLQAAPEVSSLQEDRLQTLSLAESVPLIGAPAAWAAGFTGAGQTIAILDTGIDKTHPFLAGKVVSEACYSTTNSTLTSTCPGGVAQSTEVGSGVNCDAPGCEHGTHVAGIAAGKAATFSGVAHEANLIAIKIASRRNGCISGSCVGLLDSDIIRGLERVHELRSTFNIAAVNLSLGGGRFATNCDATEVASKMAIDNLRSVGIATIVASGNSSLPGSISAPACISSAISVGSTGDGSTNGTTATLDVVSSFSNSASFLHLLAPGAWINSSVPGGGFANFPGTSMAAPHVAGAWAVLKSKSPNASVAQILMALKDTGLAVTDTRNNISKPRIRLDAAATALAATACNYTIAPATQNFSTSGGSGTVNVVSSSGCAWTASSNVPWLTVTAGSSGTSNGSVNFTAASNTGLERTGTLFVAGQTFIVTQAGVPALAVDDGTFEGFSGLRFGGTSYEVNRLTPTSYPATINAVAIFFPSGRGVRVGDALTVLAGTNPSGSATIDGVPFSRTSVTVQALDQFNVFPIPGVTTNSGDFVVGLQMSHNAGVLPYAIDSTPPNQQRSYASTDGTAFTLIANVGTPGNYSFRALLTQSFSCPTVTSVSPGSSLVNSTVTITGTGFTGVTAVRFANNLSVPFTINSDTSITTTVPANAVTGRIVISKAGSNCADVVTEVFAVIPCIALTPTVQSFMAEAGTGSIALTSRAACSWTASSNASWVTISSGSSGSGDGTVNYSVAANTSSSSRTGTITVAQQTFTVVQAATGGNCAITAIVPGQIVNGILSTTDCPSRAKSGSQADRYSFTGVRGQRVLIDLGSLFDAYLGLLDPTGAVLATNDDSGPGIDAQIAVTLPFDGTYVIEATSLSGGIAGTYTLKFGVTNHCSASIAPTSQSFPATGGPGTITLTAAADCNWLVGTDASWITVTSSRSGTGNATVSYTVAANTSSARTAVIGVAGQSFTVTQATDCHAVASLSPTSGAVGATVTITGTNLTNVTAVKFSNNVTATFTVNSPTQLTAIVPAGAVTGPLTLSKTPCADVQTGTFTVSPTVTTVAASALTSTSATLNGTVTPNGAATSISFEWGTSSTLASFISTLTQSVGSGTTSLSVSANLSGLTAGTTYYYRLAATNSAGTVKGSILPFATLNPPPSVTTLSYNGKSRDRVGASETALSSDGTLDGTFTIAFPSGSRARTVTGLDLARSGGGRWNTVPNDGAWVVGAASSLDAALFNTSTGAVIFAVADGGSFNLFASDNNNSLFNPGDRFTLTVNFADGTSSNVTTTVPALPLILGFNGKSRDRVGAGETALSSDGRPDGVFTITLPTGSGARTVTGLDLTRSAGGRWNTVPNDGAWVVGAASSPDAALFNDSAGRVNFAVADGGSFTLFASDNGDALFNLGSSFTLTITFAGGTSASASATVLTSPLTLAFGGKTRDRVGIGETALSADGLNDGVFTVTLPAGSGAYPVTGLDLTRSAGGRWNTTPNDGAWVVGAARSLDDPLLNNATGTVNFTGGTGSFNLFASDNSNSLFAPGDSFTLTASFADGTTATGSVTIQQLPLAFNFNGKSRDRVGAGETALSSDGQADGVFTVTLPTGSGARTVTGLDLTRSAGGRWNTVPNDGAWVVGAASGLDAALYNAPSGTVNFAVADGGSFNLFASDNNNSLFTPGDRFTLTVNFAGGTSSSVAVTIQSPPVTLSFNGKTRDRVGAGETALSADGLNDGVFTVTFPTGSGARTVTGLDLTRNAGGRWNTVPNDGAWVVGAASALDAALFNTATGTVNFAVADGGSFNLFASDNNNSLFSPGDRFILTLNFGDGTSATATVTVPTSLAHLLSVNGQKHGKGVSLPSLAREPRTLPGVLMNF